MLIELRFVVHDAFQDLAVVSAQVLLTLPRFVTRLLGSPFNTESGANSVVLDLDFPSPAMVVRLRPATAMVVSDAVCFKRLAADHSSVSPGNTARTAKLQSGTAKVALDKRTSQRRKPH